MNQQEREKSPEIEVADRQPIEVRMPNDHRYSRLELLRWWDQDKIRDATVLVVGAGALGNEVIKNLALLGIGRPTHRR